MGWVGNEGRLGVERIESPATAITCYRATPWWYAGVLTEVRVPVESFVVLQLTNQLMDGESGNLKQYDTTTGAPVW